MSRVCGHDFTRRINLEINYKRSVVFSCLLIKQLFFGGGRVSLPFIESSCLCLMLY